MELIETGFGWLTAYGHEHLPEGILTNLFLDGILAGLGGDRYFYSADRYFICFHLCAGRYGLYGPGYLYDG